MTKRGALLVFCLCLSWISPSSAPAAQNEEPDASADAERVLANLEERVSGIQTLKADFLQEKHLALLDQPLVLKGTLFMQKPDLFSWMVEEPLRYSLVIEGEVVRQWDEDTRRVEKMSLSKNPVFKAAIQQLRDWLSGAYTSMVGEYQVAVLEEAPISLEFVPRKTSLAHEVIDSVTVEFEPDERYIRRIQIVERSGDRTVLTFVDTQLNTPIAPSAWKVEQGVR